MAIWWIHEKYQHVRPYKVGYDMQKLKLCTSLWEIVSDILWLQNCS